MAVLGTHPAVELRFQTDVCDTAAQSPAQTSKAQAQGFVG